MSVLLSVLKTRWLVGGSCALAAIVHPTTEVYGLIGGAIINALFSKTLKKIIKQERPSTDPKHAELGHGMPSSHAQSLFYFATYLALASKFITFQTIQHTLTHEQTQTQTSPSTISNIIAPYLTSSMIDSWQLGYARIYLILALYSYAIGASVTRIIRGLHTTPQIVVGAVIGAIFAYFYECYAMPWIRLQTADVLPIRERSWQFQLGVSFLLTSISALTLERNLQKFCKACIRWCKRSRDPTKKQKDH